MTTQKKTLVEIESVGAAGKSDSGKVKKYFRLEVNIQEREFRGKRDRETSKEK